jgi:hypothetical protein
VSDRTTGVDDALGDALAVEVADLLDEVVVLERPRPAVADRAHVLIVLNRVALSCGQGWLLLLIRHGKDKLLVAPRSA